MGIRNKILSDLSYLYPSPNNRKKRRRVDYGNRVQCFRVILTGKLGGFLEMAAEFP